MVTRTAAIIIRSVAAWIVVAGAGASLVFMLHAARRQQSLLLLLLFGLLGSPRSSPLSWQGGFPGVGPQPSSAWSMC